MRRRNYKECDFLFGHVDADFVSTHLQSPGDVAKITASYYPFWSAPQYNPERYNEVLRNIDWEIAKKPVTIHAIGLIDFRLSSNPDVTDWWITRDHWLLWELEDKGNIASNGPMSLTDAKNLAVGVAAKLGEGSPWSHAGLDAVYRWGDKQSFSLGTFPRSVYMAIAATMKELSLPYFSSHEPEPKALPAILIIDESNYIIASDFEVEFEEFEHKPEWFTSS